MSNREKVINLANSVPESELLPVVEMLQALYRLTAESKNRIEEIEPDEWDLKMIEETERENDGVYFSFEEVLAEDGLTYADLQD